jgi:DNA repair protein RadC
MIVRTPHDAAALLEPLLASAEGKGVAVAYLDAEGLLLQAGVEATEAGEAALPVRAIFSRALMLGARSIVLARSHGGGDPAPSEAEQAATRELAALGRTLDVLLHDHLVFGGDEWSSYRAMGLL